MKNITEHVEICNYINLSSYMNNIKLQSFNRYLICRKIITICLNLTNENKIGESDI